MCRAIDREGNLVDTMLSATRDLAAAKAFFKQTVERVAHKPEHVTTDKVAAYRRAICHSLGRKVRHRASQYLNNRIEQGHRGVKQRCYPIRGFGSFGSAARFCTALDQVRYHLRTRSTTTNQPPPLSEQRADFRERRGALSAAWQTV